MANFQIPDWLLQITNDNPNLVEDSPTFRAVEQTQQKKNLLSATKKALSEYEDKVKQQQMLAVRQQMHALQQLKAQTAQAHKSTQDIYAKMQQPQDQSDDGGRPAAPSSPGNEQPMPGNMDSNIPNLSGPPDSGGYTNRRSDFPYDVRQPGSQPGDVTDSEGLDRSLEVNNGFDQYPPNQGPFLSPPRDQINQPNDEQRMAHDPNAVNDVMQIAQATGMSPQDVASMVLLGKNIQDINPPDTNSLPQQY